MLQTVHSSRKVKPTRFSEKRDRPRSHVRVFTALEPVYEAEGASEPERDWRLGDVGGLDLRALAERYSDTRDELAYRKLRGEALSLRDRLLLRVLNEITRMVMPRRDPIPDDVLDAVAEARRIRARRGG